MAEMLGLSEELTNALRNCLVDKDKEWLLVVL